MVGARPTTTSASSQMGATIALSMLLKEERMISEYPEHEKLSKVKDQSQAIGQFLEGCGYSLAPRLPQCCMNRECRSREWNGKKTRREPQAKPTIVLPKPVKIRGGGDEEV
ncbi:unnamed protein product [Sphagnum jensenii]